MASRLADYFCPLRVVRQVSRLVSRALSAVAGPVGGGCFDTGCLFFRRPVSATVWYELSDDLSAGIDGGARAARRALLLLNDAGRRLSVSPDSPLRSHHFSSDLGCGWCAARIYLWPFDLLVSYHPHPCDLSVCCGSNCPAEHPVDISRSVHPANI